jgi:hypothetical protein
MSPNETPFTPSYAPAELSQWLEENKTIGRRGEEAVPGAADGRDASRAVARKGEGAASQQRAKQGGARAGQGQAGSGARMTDLDRDRSEFIQRREAPER